MWKDVDLVQKVIRVQSSNSYRTKMGKKRTIPICTSKVTVIRVTSVLIQRRLSVEVLADSSLVLTEGQESYVWQFQLGSLNRIGSPNRGRAIHRGAER
jgi:uncharacterized protein (UPF0548 family)